MPASRLVCAVMCLTLAGCGGGLPDPDAAVSASKPPPSVGAPFALAAEAACANFNSKAPDDPTYDNVSEIQAGLAALNAAFMAVQSELAGLPYPPDANGEALRQILVAELDKDIRELQSSTAQFNEAVKTKNEENYYTAADRLLALEDSYPDRTGVLLRNGLQECHVAFGPPDE